MKTTFPRGFAVKRKFGVEVGLGSKLKRIAYLYANRIAMGKLMSMKWG
jgi:hypothetical protein